MGSASQNPAHYPVKTGEHDWRNIIANLIIGLVFIVLIVLTFFALYLEKSASLRQDLNGAIAAISADYYKHVCPDQNFSAEKCAVELENMKSRLRKSLNEATEQYATELVPQWATQGLVVGFVGFFIILLGFKRFESIDSLILQGHRDARQEMAARLQEVQDAITGRVLARIHEDVEQTTNAKLGDLNKRELELIRIAKDELLSNMTSEFNQREQEFKRMQDILLNEFSWLRTDQIGDLDPKLLNVQSVQVAHEMAQQLTAADKPHLALRVLRRIVEEKLSGDADDYFNASNGAMNLGNLDVAREIAEAGLAHSPGNADLRAYLGRITREQGDVAKADEIFRVLATDDKILSQYWRVSEFYTDFLASQGRYDEADALMNRYADLVHGGNRDTVHPLLNYALVKERRCDVEGAKSLLKETLLRFPGDTGIAFNLARLLMEEGKPGEAKTFVEQALLNSGESQPSVGLGTVLHLRGRIYEALAFAEAADESRGDLLRTALQSYAQVLALKGEASWLSRRRAHERLMLHGVLGGQEEEASPK